MSEGEKLDGGESRMDLIQPDWLLEVGQVLEFGARKYDDNNWKKVEGAKERYLAAAYRHLLAYHRGEKVDEESGMSHLAHASCCVMFLHELDKPVSEEEFFAFVKDPVWPNSLDASYLGRCGE